MEAQIHLAGSQSSVSVYRPYCETGTWGWKELVIVCLHIQAHRWGAGFVPEREVWQKVLMKARLLSQYRLKIHCICHCEHLHLLIANIKKALRVHLLKCLAQALNVRVSFWKFLPWERFFADFKMLTAFFWNLFKTFYLLRFIHHDQILTVTPLYWAAAEEYWDQNWIQVIQPYIGMIRTVATPYQYIKDLNKIERSCTRWMINNGGFG